MAQISSQISLQQIPDKNKISLVVLGDGGTGKSCITMRVIRSKWVDEYDPTIEDSYSTQRTVDGKTYRLDIIDTAGQEEYRDMLGSLFGADMSIDAYLLVYDITSRTSLENLEHFDELITKNLDIRPPGVPAPVKVVAGNKCDLSEHREISSQEGLAWAKAHGCGFMETSAKAMVNIEETFQIVIRQVETNRKNSGPQDSKLGHSHSRPKLRSALSAANIRNSSGSSEKVSEKERGGCCIIS
ncbi:ras-like protein 2 [Trichomonascus vanleenenianus]|uniref:Ras family protein n=1 Tax=Trichomonascus vanleenenianus TaxID=2268995 RepID=UPI003EC98C1B